MSETISVCVIDRIGALRTYDADDMHKDRESGHLIVTKSGKEVAIYEPGYICAYRAECLRDGSAREPEAAAVA